MIRSIQEFFSQWTINSDTIIAPWITAVIVILLSLLVYLVVSRVFKKSRKSLDGRTFLAAWQKLRFPLLAVFILFDLLVIKSLFIYENEVESAVNQVITLIIIFIVTWIVIRSINLSRDLILSHYDMGEQDNLKARKVSTQFRVLEKVVIFIVILIAVAIALMTFEGIRRIGISLFASAGVAGIILGFAAQKMLGSILAGFQIAITQPIRIDDVVIVEKEWGWIEEITLTYVVVRIWDKRRLVVPTTYFIEKPFQNWTRTSADILGTVFIYADYSVPVDKLREAFNGILKDTNLWDGNVGVMQVTDASDKTMEIRALMSAADSPTAWDLRVLVREKLISFLQENYPNSLPRTRVEISGDSSTVH